MMQLNSKLWSALCTIAIISLRCDAFALQQHIAFNLKSRVGHLCHMSTAGSPVALVPELRAPKDLFANVVNIGATKAKLAPLKTFLLGIKSGCHISFGERDVSHHLLGRNNCAHLP